MAQRKKADSTSRASEKPDRSQQGPTEEDLGSKKKTTDTRGTRERSRTATHKPDSPADVADKQPVRKDPPKRSKRVEIPAPVERQKVSGQTVEVVALPSKVDPTELRPSKRDTITKDALRHHGRNEEADAPTKRVHDDGPLPPLEEVV